MTWIFVQVLNLNKTFTVRTQTAIKFKETIICVIKMGDTVGEEKHNHCLHTGNPLGPLRPGKPGGPSGPIKPCRDKTWCCYTERLTTL